MENNSVEYMVSSALKGVNNFKGNYVIGIDGYSCAGKTSITKELLKSLEKNYEVAVFHIDDFITTRKHRYNTGYEQWYEYFQLQWKVDYIRDALFIPLKSNESKIKLNYYHKDEDCNCERTYEVVAKSIIIIEGVFLQRAQWREFFNYMIFVNCPRDIRFEREIIRSNHQNNVDETIDKYKVRYWAAEDYYDKTYEPLKWANLIIDNY